MLSAGSQKPVVHWAGVESNPSTSTGRDFPVLQICIEALEKGHICSVLTCVRGLQQCGQIWGPRPTELWGSQGKCERAAARAPLLGIWSQFQHWNRSRQKSGRSFIMCKAVWLSEPYCKVHFLGMFSQQIHHSASACSFPKEAFLIEDEGFLNCFFMKMMMLHWAKSAPQDGYSEIQLFL